MKHTENFRTPSPIPFAQNLYVKRRPESPPLSFSESRNFRACLMKFRVPDVQISSILTQLRQSIRRHRDLPLLAAVSYLTSKGTQNSRSIRDFANLLGLPKRPVERHVQRIHRERTKFNSDACESLDIDIHPRLPPGRKRSISDPLQNGMVT